MATDEPAQAETADAPTTAELSDRVDALDGKLDTILAKLGSAEGKAHEGAERHTEERLDRSSTVADDIARALEDRDRKAKADKDATDDAEWRQGVNDQLAGLTEKVPEPPVRRVEKAMGWR